MHPRELQIKDFTYELPDEKIARYPLAQRDLSKVLIWENERIGEDIYANLAKYIPENSLLVFNNTKVIEARLLFEKPNGGKIEIFCLEPHEQYGDITSAMLQRKKVLWKCLVGGAKKWKEGLLSLSIPYNNGTLILTTAKKEQLSDSFIIELNWNDEQLSFAEVLHLAGAIPLPPYLNREAEISDKERYQTIYAQHDGSVAAPTAGLHFTPGLFESLKQKHIQSVFTTLHVGAGTFKPVKAETMDEHEMHAEFIDVHIDLIEQLRLNLTNNIIPVGTTSLRTIESLYWLGVKIIVNPSIQLQQFFLSQWEAYALAEKNIEAADALRALMEWMKKNKTERLITKTQIIIAPGYQFRIIDALITNFHQPQSTLLLLVAAITGNNWKHIYQYALKHAFRFLSYGDGSLLWVKE